MTAGFSNTNYHQLAMKSKITSLRVGEILWIRRSRYSFSFLPLPHTALRLYGATEIRPLRGHVACLSQSVELMRGS